MNGWCKLHKKFMEWRWYHKSEMVHLFIHLILKANHSKGYFEDKQINRGQLVTSLKSLSMETGISVQTIRTCLGKLKSTQEITSESTNKYRIITICNYDSYQDGQTTTNKQSNNQLTNNQQTTNKQLTTIEEYKKDKKDKKDKKRRGDSNESLKLDFQKIYNHYVSKGNLVNNREFTKEMKACIKIARSRLNLTDDDMCKLIDRHSIIVDATKDSEYPVQKRPLAQFFGQKVYKANHLICSEYLDDGAKWLRYNDKNKSGKPLVIGKGVKK